MNSYTSIVHIRNHNNGWNKEGGCLYKVQSSIYFIFINRTTTSPPSCVDTLIIKLNLNRSNTSISIQSLSDSKENMHQFYFSMQKYTHLWKSHIQFRIDIYVCMHVSMCMWVSMWYVYIYMCVCTSWLHAR